MNGYCSKDIVTSIVYTYNHGKYFCIDILFVWGVCMFDGIAEHEVAEPQGCQMQLFFCFFYEIPNFSICFFLIYFYLMIW